MILSSTWMQRRELPNIALVTGDPGAHPAKNLGIAQIFVGCSLKYGRKINDPLTAEPDPTTTFRMRSPTAEIR